MVCLERLRSARCGLRSEPRERLTPNRG